MARRAAKTSGVAPTKTSRRRLDARGARTNRPALQLELPFDESRDHAPRGDERLQAGEFFAGIGLVRLALEQAGISVAFANDIDRDKRAMYVTNFGPRDFHLGDVRALSTDHLPTCDLFTASFPCNDLSVAGAMRGLNSGQSSAFWGFLQVLQGLESRRPPLIMLENVPGFLLSEQGRDLRQALLALNDLGYAVDVLMVDAAYFVPQSRLRLFVVAKRLDAPAALDQAAPPGVSTTRPKPLVEFIQANPDVRWDLAELPELAVERRTLTSILERLPEDDPAWWSPERTDYFMSQLSDRHRAVAETMIAGKRSSYATAFRRVRRGKTMAELRTDGLAGCLRTPRGGSGRQILFKAGGGRRQVRLLTPRECARLQGVPDSYRIETSFNQALFGFGDAVCVPAVGWIARHYLAPWLRRRRDESQARGG